MIIQTAHSLRSGKRDAIPGTSVTVTQRPGITAASEALKTQKKDF